jgi:DNA-binding transcriptional ArsR family regulator
MLRVLFGNPTVEDVLLFIAAYGEGYAQQIADTFELSLFRVQRQLLKLEEAGILVSQLKGKTRMFTWNPRYPYSKELKALLNRMIEFMPKAQREKYFLQRRRPRRTGKPL